jgi:hypothetical protein
MNVLQKTGWKQEALPFRVTERNGDVSPIDKIPYRVAARITSGLPTRPA